MTRHIIWSSSFVTWLKVVNTFNFEWTYPQVYHHSGLSTALTAALVEWRFCMTASGEPSVTTSGTSEMLRWCAESWTVEQLRPPNLVPTLVKAVETSGWMMSTVSAMRRPFCTADIPAWEKTTVAMAKMPAWCAQVISHCFYLIVTIVVKFKFKVHSFYFSVWIPV